MLILGITGGIATGKSTVSKLFESWGAMLIDADRIAREVVSPGTEAWKKLIDEFGDRILLPNKQINRRVLAELVFTDTSALKKLNDIVHPPVISTIKQQINQLRNSQFDGIIVIEAALFVETDTLSFLDKLLVVTCSTKLQIQRLVTKKGLTKEQARARVNAQIPDTEKLKFADYVIENNGDITSLESSAKSIWQQIIDQKP